MADNIVLPVEQYPEQTFRMDFDGVPTTMRFYWSEWDESLRAIANDIDDGSPVHEGCWYFDIATDEFTVNGIPVVQGCDMLEPFAQSSLGGMFVVNLLDKPLDLTFETMGVNHLVLYVLKENLETFYSLIGYA
jgi:hypothetical protein